MRWHPGTAAFSLSAVSFELLCIHNKSPEGSDLNCLKSFDEHKIGKLLANKLTNKLKGEKKKMKTNKKYILMKISERSTWLFFFVWPGLISFDKAQRWTLLIDGAIKSSQQNVLVAKPPGLWSGLISFNRLSWELTENREGWPHFGYFVFFFPPPPPPPSPPPPPPFLPLGWDGSYV